MSLPERELVAEPVTGWRMWRLARKDGAWALGGVGIGDKPWSAGEADCLLGLDHDVPDKDCKCGYWILKSKHEMYSAIIGYWNPVQYVYGEVQGWGRLVEGDVGYRVQYARPSKLYVVAPVETRTEIKFDLEERYNCPVEIVGLPQVETFETFFGDLTATLDENYVQIEMLPSGRRAWPPARKLMVLAGTVGLVTGIQLLFTNPFVGVSVFGLWCYLIGIEIYAARRISRGKDPVVIKAGRPPK